MRDSHTSHDPAPIDPDGNPILGHCVKNGGTGWTDISSEDVSLVKRAYRLCLGCPRRAYCEQELDQNLARGVKFPDQVYAGVIFDPSGNRIAGRKYIGRPGDPAAAAPKDDGRTGAA